MKTTAKHVIGASALMLLLLADLQPATAQGGVEPSPIGQLARGLNPANWTMPQWRMPDVRQLLPGNDEKARIKKKKDGLFTEVTKTASNSWNKTKAALSPQRLNPINFFPASARTPSTSPVEENKPGFFRSLFTPAPPAPRDDSTVTDFLRQSRPSP